MRIALRTSGGRGEYELAGHQAETPASSLFDKELEFQLSPETILPGLQAARRVQGKPRIRRVDRNGIHAYRLLAGALVLPKPKRELGATSTGGNFVRDGQFAVSGIDVDIVSSTASDARLRPKTLSLENASGSVQTVDVAERMALVQGIWNAAHAQAGPVAELVRQHEAAVQSGGHKSIERASVALRAAFAGDGDVIELIGRALGVEIEAPRGPSPDAPATSDEGEDDETDPKQAARQAVTKWRRTVQRTAAARKFSEDVRRAYKSKCAVCGKRLPKLFSIPSAGIEGAHILPWARYELNTLKNGLCLDQLCHWAFDAGVIRIDWDGTDYVVSIPDQVRTEAKADGFDIGYFERFVGAIAADRLPDRVSQRPSPRYLALLAKEMYG